MRKKIDEKLPVPRESTTTGECICGCPCTGAAAAKDEEAPPAGKASENAGLWEPLFVQING